MRETHDTSSHPQTLTAMHTTSVSTLLFQKHTFNVKCLMFAQKYTFCSCTLFHIVHYSNPNGKLYFTLLYKISKLFFHSLMLDGDLYCQRQLKGQAAP